MSFQNFRSDKLERDVVLTWYLFTVDELEESVDCTFTLRFGILEYSYIQITTTHSCKRIVSRIYATNNNIFHVDASCFHRLDCTQCHLIVVSNNEIELFAG